MTEKKDFKRDYKDGDIAKKFVMKYLGELTGIGWLPGSIVSHERLLEGDDSHGIAFASNEQMLHVAAGNYEIKAIRAKKNSACGKVLCFYKLGHKEIPTLEFELYSDSTQGTKGWLYAMYHPDEFNAQKQMNNRKERTTVPSIFTYLCYCNDAYGYRPFMAITMQNFYQVLQVLKEYAKSEYEWDFDRWDLPEVTDTEYWNWFEKRNIVKENVWNVPMDVLLTARNFYITMIDDPPTNMNGEQKKRYDYFKKIAGDHFLNTRAADEARKKVEEFIHNEQDDPQIPPEEEYAQTIDQFEAESSLAYPPIPSTTEAHTVDQERNPVDE